MTRKLQQPDTLVRRRWICRELTRGAQRLRNVTAGRVLADIVRAVRLHVQEPTPRKALLRPERLVVTLTTIPQRASQIKYTLRSLRDQTWPADMILLAWPSRSLRTGDRYPPPPAVGSGVAVVPCEDIGPATKLLPALKLEPRSLIVVVDDDLIYPADFLETLLRAHRSDPSAAWGYRGVNLDPTIDPRDFDHVFATAVAQPTAVDVLFGTWGYLIPPEAFDHAVHDIENAPPQIRWVDDIWFSGHLARRGVPRNVVRANGFPIETLACFQSALTNGPNRDGRNDTMAIQAFADFW